MMVVFLFVTLPKWFGIGMIIVCAFIGIWCDVTWSIFKVYNMSLWMRESDGVPYTYLFVPWNLKIWSIIFIIICSERERQQFGVSDACGCLWSYLAELHSSDGQSHVHFNLFYDPMKHDGPLLPPAAALAPTLWPQFHLRWACPKEVEAGDIEAKCRSMDSKLSDLQKVTGVLCFIWTSWLYCLIPKPLDGPQPEKGGRER